MACSAARMSLAGDRRAAEQKRFPSSGSKYSSLAARWLKRWRPVAGTCWLHRPAPATTNGPGGGGLYKYHRGVKARRAEKITDVARRLRATSCSHLAAPACGEALVVDVPSACWPAVALRAEESEITTAMRRIWWLVGQLPWLEMKRQCDDNRDDFSMSFTR